MRIIGGTVRGRTLFTPRGMATRPTQDAVRESLFNILRAAVPDARVLDLFAGTGALALEALSRGAGDAVLVDRGQEAMQAVRRNVAHTGFEGQCLCLLSDWQAALKRLAAQERRFDLVFLDPPYDTIDIMTVLSTVAASGVLAPEALLVAEHRARTAVAPEPPLAAVDQRRYGDTTVTIIRWEGGDPHETGHLSGQL